MKTLSTSILILAFLAACATPPSASMKTVRVEAVSGEADISSPGTPPAKLRKNQKISVGTTVQTWGGGRVDFDLGESGGVLVLHPDSTLTFEAIEPHSADVVAVLNLSQGRVTGDTLKLHGHRKIVVKTPAGVHEIP